MKKEIKIDDNKKVYQINISLNSSEYNLIKTLAFLERRSVAEIARLILIDNALQLHKTKYCNYQKAVFIPLKEDVKK